MKRRYVWTIITGVIVLAFALVFSDKLLCSGKSATAECVLSHPYPLFVVGEFGNTAWETTLATVSANPCKNIDLTARFFSFSERISNLAHYNEEIAELIDRTIAEDPKCFLNIAKKMDSKGKSHIKNFFLGIIKRGNGFKSEGKEALMPFHNDPRYADTVRELL